MSTIKTTTLSNVAGTSSVPVDTVINGSAKAWVNFNGTGTVAIRASFNVSSITDNGTGDYTVNFTTALQDANFCSSFAFSRQTDAPSGNIATNNSTGLDVAPTTTTLRVGIFLFGTGGKDVSYVNVAIFR